MVPLNILLSTEMFFYARHQNLNIYVLLVIDLINGVSGRLNLDYEDVSL